MLVSLTVGKVDAGVAVLLTEDKRLIEFPSILLPPDISSGSIVDVNVSRNTTAESHATKAFHALQSQILSAFGSESPVAPVLRCRNATQTSVVLEWDPIALATASLRTLSLYRNGNKAGTIPRPTEMTSTKISGLAVDTEYTFYLVLKTSAGTYGSEKLTVRTHKMTDLSGITVTPGIMPRDVREELEATVRRMGAKIIEQVRIDTTHFVCEEGRGAAWEKASDMNIPVVVPEWAEGCVREGRLVGVRGYYLNADPKVRAASVVEGGAGQRPVRERQVSQRLPTPRTEVTPPTPEMATGPGVGRDAGGGATPTPLAREMGKAEAEPVTPSSRQDGVAASIRDGSAAGEVKEERTKEERVQDETTGEGAVDENVAPGHGDAKVAVPVDGEGTLGAAEARGKPDGADDGEEQGTEDEGETFDEVTL